MRGAVLGEELPEEERAVEREDEDEEDDYRGIDADHDIVARQRRDESGKDVPSRRVELSGVVVAGHMQAGVEARVQEMADEGHVHGGIVVASEGFRPVYLQQEEHDG